MATLSTPDRASRREVLADVHPTPAKASLCAQVDASLVRTLAAEALRTACPNQRAAAIDMSIHEAHLSRQLKDGSLTLARLERLGPAFAAEFGRRLVDMFGPLVTPVARAKQQILEIRHRLEDLDQAVYFLARG